MDNAYEVSIRIDDIQTITFLAILYLSSLDCSNYNNHDKLLCLKQYNESFISFLNTSHYFHRLNDNKLSLIWLKEYHEDINFPLCKCLIFNYEFNKPPWRLQIHIMRSGHCERGIYVLEIIR